MASRYSYVKPDTDISLWMWVLCLEHWIIFFKRNKDIEHHETRSAAKLPKLTFKTVTYEKYFERSMSSGKCGSNNANINHNSTNIYLLKVNDRNIRKRCEICSRLTIKTPERPQWRVSVTCYYSSASIIDFEQVNVSCEITISGVQCFQKALQGGVLR